MNEVIDRLLNKTLFLTNDNWKHFRVLWVLVSKSTPQGNADSQMNFWTTAGVDLQNIIPQSSVVWGSVSTSQQLLSLHWEACLVTWNTWILKPPLWNLAYKKRTQSIRLACFSKCVPILKSLSKSYFSSLRPDWPFGSSLFSGDLISKPPC